MSHNSPHTPSGAGSALPKHLSGERHYLRCFISIAAAIALTRLPGMWSFLSVPVAGFALWAGARALLFNRRFGRRGAINMACWVGVGVTLGILVAMLIFRVPYLASEYKYQNCLQHAITLSAQSTCESALDSWGRHPMGPR